MLLGLKGWRRFVSAPRDARVRVCRPGAFPRTAVPPLFWFSNMGPPPTTRGCGALNAGLYNLDLIWEASGGYKKSGEGGAVYLDSGKSERLPAGNC